MMIENEEDVVKKNSSSTGFLILFVIQFLLVLATMFADVKLGLITLGFVIVASIVIIIQKNENEQTDWSASKNSMLLLYSIWALYCIAEIANPNNVQEAWNIAIAPYFVFPVLLSIIVPVSITRIKDIEKLLIIWGIFLCIVFVKAYWQKNHGFSQRDLIFLYNLGGASTHIIWSGIRYFSCLGNAANYGVHAAMGALVFGISLFYIKNIWLKLFFVLITLSCIYGIGLSGTRSAIAVPVGGIICFGLLSRNWKAISLGTLVLIFVFAFFRLTTIGNGNEYVRKMRSAFNPTEDASYQARVTHREEMKILMESKPFGYGLGLSKGERYKPKEVMPYAPDSWLIAVWVETGVVGIILYIIVNGILFVWCSWIILCKIANKRLRGLLSAWLSMNAGFFAAAYVNDVMQYPSVIIVYTGFALCFAGPQIDRNMQEEKDNSKHKSDEAPSYE